MSKEKFYKWLAISYAVVLSIIVYAIFASGIFWDFIHYVCGERMRDQLWRTYHLTNAVYFIVLFFNIIVKAAAIFYIGIALEKRSRHS